jgi:nucleoid-associated protein YgaU
MSALPGQFTDEPVLSTASSGCHAGGQMLLVSLRRFTVSKSRKLAVAAMLLAGGYVAALLLGGVPELVLPVAESTSTGEAESGWLAGFKRWMSDDEVSPNVGQIVPESILVRRSDQSGSNVRATSNAPTWLSTSSEPVGATPVASQPPAAAPPKLLEAAPITIAKQSAEPQPLLPPMPKARITDVRSVAAVSSSQRSASSWDRWPRWSANEPGVTREAVPATFQDLNSAPQPTVASFDVTAVTKKNSPPRDPGVRPADALRTHVVIDGDTLTRLADRYLDDSDRSTEIYGLNRDLLTNPELLPIGVELRIPPRKLIADIVASHAPAGGIAAVDSLGSSGMVPVPWMPKPFGDAPQAELMRPIPARQSE